MDEAEPGQAAGRWLNRTVIGIGAASFLSDVSHETATALLPLLAADLGNPAAVLGSIEGISDAASGAAKLWSGWLSDRLPRRRPLAVAGYLLSAVSCAGLAASARAWQAVASRAVAWAGRGLRTPPRSALLAGDVPAAHYGKAFGLERALDTLGAVVGPLGAAVLIVVIPYRVLLWWTILPGLLAAGAMAFLVRERPHRPVKRRPFTVALAALPSPFRRYLAAVGLFGLGDFAHSFLILRASEILSPALGPQAAAAAAISLYVLHNITGALMAFLFGAASDRLGRFRLLTLAYLLGPAMLLMLAIGPAGASASLMLPAIFILAGTMRAGESSLESAAAAELLPEDQRGMGFGALAAVNSAGDLISSLMVGILWSRVGPAAAFGVAVVPMLSGVILMATMRRR